MQTTVLQKGGHTVAVQYARVAESRDFTLKGWNLAVQAYPEAAGTDADRTGRAANSRFRAAGSLGAAAPASPARPFFPARRPAAPGSAVSAEIG